jgi:PhoH-like ATPase
VEDSDIRRTQRRGEKDEFEAIDLPGHSVQAFASAERIELPQYFQLPANAYVLLRNQEEHSHGVPARHIGNGEFVTLRRDHITIRGGRHLQAANLGQRFFLDALFDPDITLITVYGKAGTGKTLLSVGAALEQVQSGDYEKMLITRVIMPTGKDIGFLPGRMEEKMQPWVQPAYDALEQLLAKPRKPEHFEQKRQSKRKAGDPGLSDRSGPQQPGKVARPYEPLMAAGLLEVEAIAHIRGRSIPRAIFIVDEAQQLTPHEAKTLVTRMGKGAKIILIGDLAQIDNPYVDAHTNGLVFTRNRLQGQPFMAHINLFKGERSIMAEVAANLM